MKLSAYTDYTLRTLIFLAGRAGRPATILDIAELHGLSRHHLGKVVMDLARDGLVRTTRGRGGGIVLGREPERINIGAVVRGTETGFDMAACFNATDRVCAHQGCCGLKAVLEAATAAYLARLDALSLADLAPGPALVISDDDYSLFALGG
ncbi:RrF2 family transcriptional regulator [Pseudoduganella aquatica]|uniref:Rrf2 family transcriptional regulator n=1 Tax=Pseudoduganella aquatica TaxID=2660641 RepID=A0A7X4KPQ5_9BURK|nr:Rrf2 family transcriptional regulator [Pseudoduganella aquatica]MYN10150.1 Rrf2 family transcriptional regulator [Pseudoduganella aquatica]